MGLLYHELAEQGEVILLQLLDLGDKIAIIDILGYHHQHLANNPHTFLLLLPPIPTLNPLLFPIVLLLADRLGDIVAPLDHALDEGLLFGEEEIVLGRPLVQDLAHCCQLGLDLGLEELATDLVVHLVELSLR